MTFLWKEFVTHDVKLTENVTYVTADRAKAIKTKAVVNESPTDKLIRELREENKRLMEMLKKGGGGGGSEEGIV